MAQAYFDYAAALVGCFSAYYWVQSARVKIPTGFDMGREQAVSFEEASKLNSRAAALAAVSVAIPAVKTFLVFFSLIH